MFLPTSGDSFLSALAHIAKFRVALAEAVIKLHDFLVRNGLRLRRSPWGDIGGNIIIIINIFIYIIILIFINIIIIRFFCFALLFGKTICFICFFLRSFSFRSAAFFA